MQRQTAVISHLKSAVRLCSCSGRQTAVTSYLTSEQWLLFVFVSVSGRQTTITFHLTCQQLLLFVFAWQCGRHGEPQNIRRNWRPRHDQIYVNTAPSRFCFRSGWFRIIDRTWLVEVAISTKQVPKVWSQPLREYLHWSESELSLSEERSPRTPTE